MSWESTVPYYQIINRAVGKRLGGLHSATILLYSVDFDEIERLQHADRWAEAGSLPSEAAVALEGAGADFPVLCNNTRHAPSCGSSGLVRARRALNDSGRAGSGGGAMDRKGGIRERI
jgi:hypothetical protein